MFRKLLVLTAVFGLALLPSAMLAQGAEKQQIVVDLVNEPSTLDPQLQWNPDSYFVYRNIFDNLVTRDNSGKIVPEIATAWKALSDTKITFTLRADVTFH
ncbi:MAG TPA: peptide ABC transporter, partial [Rhizobium sp.]